MLQTGFAIDGSDFDPLDPMPLVDFLHLPIREALWPSKHRMRYPALCAVARLGVTTTNRLQQRRLIAGIRIREHRRPMPRPKPTLGIVDYGLRLFLGPFADDERHHELAIGRDRRMVPHVPRLGALLCPTPLLL